MRNITIQRRKRFVACAAKMKVYIEDAMRPELEINGVPCRKLGELKNGAQQTFTVGDEPAKLFVIAGKTSKNYCNDFVQLPQGSEDLFFSGQNEMNTASGNAFRFDCNDPETVQNRQQGKKKGWGVLIVAILIGAVVGFLIPKLINAKKASEPKTFTSHGMSITLTEEFEESARMGYTFSYEGDYVICVGLREAFDLYEGLEDISLQEYGELVLEANELTDNELKEKDGLTYFDYDNYDPESKLSYRYFCYLMKCDDAFWMIQFSTLESKVDEYEDDILKWVKSVQFE